MKDIERSWALFTDFYELTMAQAYCQSQRTAPATFSFFIRSLPPHRAYFVFAGLDDVLDYLEGLRFTLEEVDYLRSLGRFEGGFLRHLEQLRFTGSVRAMAEGSIFFADEPVLEVTAPVIEGQLIETLVINRLNLHIILATKASRVVHAAAGRPVVDFAARRTQGLDAADTFARVSYLVGFESTSNTLAGARYGIPVSGTMAHSYITTFEKEIDSFRQYAASFPDTSTFLVDTYDTLEGVRKAIVVAREMKAHGHRLHSIRLDSGDLRDLARQSRRLLDDAGLPDVQIFASGGLDEFAIDDLLKAGAPIDGFGVGTKVGVSADAPWTDCVYKLVDYAGRPVLKLSTGKETLPGPKQVFRRADPAGDYIGDVIAVADEAGPAGTWPLLQEFLKDGKRLTAAAPLGQLRSRFREEFARLPRRHKQIRSPDSYPVHISETLANLRAKVAAEATRREIASHETHTM